MRGPGLAGHCVVGNPRVGRCGATRLGGGFQHADELFGYLRFDDRLGIVLATLDKSGWMHHAAIGNRRVCVGELQHSDVEAVAVAENGLFAQAPAAARLQVTGRFSGKTTVGAGTETERAVGVVHQTGVEIGRDVCSAHVARLGDDARGREYAPVVRVVDVVPEKEPVSTRGVDQRAGRRELAAG